MRVGKVRSFANAQQGSNVDIRLSLSTMDGDEDVSMLLLQPSDELFPFHTASLRLCIRAGSVSPTPVFASKHVGMHDVAACSHWLQTVIRLGLCLGMFRSHSAARFQQWMDLFLEDHCQSFEPISLLAVATDLGALVIVPFFEQYVRANVLRQSAVHVHLVFGVDSHESHEPLDDDFVLVDMPARAPGDRMAEELHCQQCRCTFGLLLRKHHCRICKGVFCETCSSNRLNLGVEAEDLAQRELGISVLGRAIRSFQQGTSRLCQPCFVQRTDLRFHHVYRMLEICTPSAFDIITLKQVWPKQVELFEKKGNS
jgi:hypothetical protein